MSSWSVRKPGFSLVELVIVVVIIGIIAAIAVPRLTRGSEAAGEAALLADLAAFRTAIDLYSIDHMGSYPAILTALTKYTSQSGAVSSNPSSIYKYGPYLRTGESITGSITEA